MSAPVADVDDRDGSEGFFVEQLVECVDDRFLSALDAQIRLVGVLCHILKPSVQLKCPIRSCAARPAAAEEGRNLCPAARTTAAASSTERTSFAMYGTETASADAPRGLPVTSANCPTPIMWHTASPSNARSRDEGRFMSLPAAPHSATRGRNPHTKPARERHELIRSAREPREHGDSARAESDVDRDRKKSALPPEEEPRRRHSESLQCERHSRRERDAYLRKKRRFKAAKSAT